MGSQTRVEDCKMHGKYEFVCLKWLFICLAASATTTLMSTLPTYSQTASSSTYGPFPCVSTDQRANASASNNGFLVPSTCQQYFGVGAALAAPLVSAEANYYGVAIPAPASQPGSLINTGIQPKPDDYYLGATPAFIASPSFDAAQYNYCATNSLNGRSVFVGVASTPSSCLFTASTSSGIVTPNNPGTTAVQSFPSSSSTSPLFAFSDTPLSAGELSTYASTKLPTRGNPIQVPVATDNIAAAINRTVTNGTDLRLSASDLCHVFDGSYTNYNQLTGTTGLSGSIKVIIRSDNSDMTLALTSYLAAMCNSNNPALNLPVVTRGFTGYYLLTGNNVFPSLSPTANFLRVPGDSATVNTIATTTGGLGYTGSGSIIGSLTTSSSAPSPSLALLQNPVSGNYIGPGHSSMKNYLRNVSLTSDATYPCILTLTGATTALTDGTVYPLTNPVYGLLYSKYATVLESEAARGLFNFMLLNTYPRTSTETTMAPFTVNDLIAQTYPDFFILRKSPGNTIISFPDTNALRAKARACISTIIGP
jgi:ABC-type phosphate transport system substrate-binding protein